MIIKKNYDHRKILTIEKDCDNEKKFVIIEKDCDNKKRLWDSSYVN